MLSQAEIDQLQLNYEGRIGSLRAVDDHVGKLVKTLRKTGQLRNTMIMFLSDNGWLQGEHRIPGDKFLPYEESIRIPLIIRGPGVPAGQDDQGAGRQHRLRPDPARRRQGEARAQDGRRLADADHAQARRAAPTAPSRSRRPRPCSSGRSRTTPGIAPTRACAPTATPTSSGPRPASRSSTTGARIRTSSRTWPAIPPTRRSRRELAAKLVKLDSCAGRLVPESSRRGRGRPQAAEPADRDHRPAAPPRHWPEQPGWLDELMPNDAELARTGLSFSNAFCNTAMCSPSRATLFTGRYPAEHGVKLTLTAADLQPGSAQRPATSRARWRASCATARRPARRVLQAVRPSGLFEPRPALRGRAGAAAGDAQHGDAAAGGGLHGRLQGQVAPDPPLDQDGLLGGWGPRDAEADRARLRLHRLGGARRGREREGRQLRRRQRGQGEGWDEVYTQQAEAWLGQKRTARAVLPDRLAGQPPRRAGLSRLIRARRLRAGRLPRARRRSAPDPRGGPEQEARGPLADADGDERLPGPPARPRGGARLRQLLRLPAPGGRREDRPPQRGPRQRR